MKTIFFMLAFLKKWSVRKAFLLKEILRKLAPNALSS